MFMTVYLFMYDLIVCLLLLLYRNHSDVIRLSILHARTIVKVGWRVKQR